MAQAIAGDWVYMNSGSKRQNTVAHRIADLPENEPGIGAPYKMECGRTAGYGVTPAAPFHAPHVCKRCEATA